MLSRQAELPRTGLAERKPYKLNESYTCKPCRVLPGTRYLVVWPEVGDEGERQYLDGMDPIMFEKSAAQRLFSERQAVVDRSRPSGKLLPLSERGGIVNPTSRGSP